MAKHRTLRKQRTRRALLAGAATVSASGAIALAHAPALVDMSVHLAADNTVIGVGGKDDTTSARVPDKLSGALTPPGTSYTGIAYPASLDLNGSRDAGVPTLDRALLGHSGDNANAVGYSEGTLVAEQERRNLQAMSPTAAAATYGNLHFTQIASPFVGNGGVFARFPQTPTFLIVDNMGPAEPTRYDTDYVTNEYDPYGDFPAYANPFSLVNSAFAIEYAHPDAYYNAINPATSRQLGTTKTVVNSAGGTDTYTLYYNEKLPLLGPFRQISQIAGVTPFTEPVLSLVEPELRVLVDAGYTDRTNAHPETPTAFSLITPPERILGALQATPGALSGGAGNLTGGAQTLSPTSTPSPTPSAGSRLPALTSGSIARPTVFAGTSHGSHASTTSAPLADPAVGAGSSTASSTASIGSPTTTPPSGGIHVGENFSGAGAGKNIGNAPSPSP